MGVRRRQVSRAALLSALVGDVRRQLSLQAVRQQARLLIDRIATVGNGTGAAAQRRDWAVELEAVASRRRRAQEVSRRQGRNICAPWLRPYIKPDYVIQCHVM